MKSTKQVIKMSHIDSRDDSSPKNGKSLDERISAMRERLGFKWVRGEVSGITPINGTKKAIILSPGSNGSISVGPSFKRGGRFVLDFPADISIGDVVELHYLTNEGWDYSVTNLKVDSGDGHPKEYKDTEKLHIDYRPGQERLRKEPEFRYAS